MLLIFCALVSTGALWGIETVAHSKHRLSVLLFLIWLFLFIVGNHEVADYGNYLIEYQRIDWSGIRLNYWAFDFIQCISKSLGLSFDGFRAIIYMIGLFFVGVFVRKTSGWSILFFFFYSIYPMMIDAAQMKNFIAMAIFSYAMTFLRGHSVNNYIKYMFYSFLAAGFHIAILIFFPLIIFKKLIHAKYFTRVFLLCIIATSLILSIGSFNESIKSVLIIFFSGELESKVDEVFSNTVRFGYLIYYVATFLAFLIIRWIHKSVKYIKNISEIQKDFIDNAYVCSIYAFSFFPFYMVWSEFSRFFRDLFLIFSAAVVIGIQICAPKFKYYAITDKQAKLFFSYLVLLFYLFYFGIYVYFDIIIYPLFNLNVWL